MFCHDGRDSSYHASHSHAYFIGIAEVGWENDRVCKEMRQTTSEAGYY